MNNKNPSEIEFDNFCEKFDIEKHAKSYINSQAFLDTGIKKRLSEDGYVILKNVVSKKILEEIRRYWLNPEIKKSRKLVQNQNPENGLKVILYNVQHMLACYMK